MSSGMRGYSQVGINNPNYKHGLTNKPTFCVDCGKRITGYRQKRCKGCFAKGELNSNWKGGIDSPAHKIRNSDEYKLWRTSVFVRDNFICKGCGSTKSGTFHAHHILSFTRFPHKRFDISNGVTLCRECHQLQHSNIILKDYKNE